MEAVEGWAWRPEVKVPQGMTGSLKNCDVFARCVALFFGQLHVPWVDS